MPNPRTAVACTPGLQPGPVASRLRRGRTRQRHTQPGLPRAWAPARAGCDAGA